MILRFDRIPRYGRIYTYNSKTKESTMHWRYQDHGLWGFYLLDNLGWLHDYVGEAMDRYGRYEIYNNANWRQELKSRRRIGIWPKPTEHYVRVSHRRVRR